MKKILFALSILLLAVSCGKGETPTPTPPTPTPPASKYQKYANENEIKIMSFNVRTSGMDKDTPNHWENRKEACLALIKDHMPDIMGVQEATFTNQWLWLKDQLKSSGYDGYGLNRQTGTEEKNGECPGILYNTNVIKKIEVGTFWLSETPDKPSLGWDAGYYRTATWGLFEHIATGKEFLYINTHLDHESYQAQVGGMQLIYDKFKKEEKKVDAYFLTGDLNVTDPHDALEILDGYMLNARITAKVTDSYGTTNGFTNPDATKQIDHIYYNKKLNKPIEYCTIKDAYNGVQFVSDHYPIYTIIKLK